MTVRELTDAAYAVIGLYEGASIKSDLSDYEARAITLINILLGEISVIDCRIKREPATISRVGAFTDRLPTCDIISSSVLPYGLAALLTLGEDDNVYLALLDRYNKQKASALTLGRAKAEPINEVYS